MHNTINEALEMIDKLLPQIEKKDREIIICPNYTILYQLSKVFENTELKLGSQNMYYEEKGAYTGEISPVFLKDAGVTHVIIGHSERRHVFGEDDESINKKIKTAIEYGLNPILCVGEVLLEREKGITLEVIKEQIEKGLLNLKEESLKNLIIAYEPVWAIGTGKTATKEDANEVIGYIRKLLKDSFSENLGSKTRILYGGSVKPSNIKELMGMSEIDGVLVGGASLKADEFAKIINY